MAKHLDKFTQPFRDSPIPFALAEILTNGSGEMVDLVCRFLNPAAAALLGLSPEECLAIEDSPTGIQAARAAGLQVVGYKGGSVEQDTRKAHWEVRSFQEIPSLPPFRG